MPHALTVCSLCLRVQRGSLWVPAEQVIRQTRSYSLEAVPRLQGAICDDCEAALRRRRGEQLAA